jgi:hypothetical protein
VAAIGDAAGHCGGARQGCCCAQKATSQIMTLAHRCGVCNERLLTQSGVTSESGEQVSPKPFVLLLPRPILRVGSRERRAPPRRAALFLGEDGQAFGESCLGGATTAGGELANVVEEDGALQVVELRGVHGDLGEEGIGHEDRGLVAMARVGIA